MTRNALNVCHQLEVLNKIFRQFLQPFGWTNAIKSKLLLPQSCTVDFIAWSSSLDHYTGYFYLVIRCPREMIILLFLMYLLANKFNEIEISSAPLVNGADVHASITKISYAKGKKQREKKQVADFII